MPFIGVTFANAEQHGEGWLISADDGENTYCPPEIPAPWNAPAPAGMLVGDALQIVLPERGLTRALSLAPESLAAVHSSGLCVALYEGKDLTLYDPVSDRSDVVLSSSSELASWDTPIAFF